MSKNNADDLLALSSVQARLEKIQWNSGSAGLTPSRIVEVVADVMMPELGDRVRVCPGWGATHLWQWQLQAVKQGIVERCSSHPERRIVRFEL